MKSQNHPQENPFAASEAQFFALCDNLKQDKTLTISAVEGVLQKQGSELLRQLLQDRLNLVASREISATGVVGPDKIIRKAKRRQSRQIETLFGSVILKRLGYGTEGFDSVHPLDAELNLPRCKYTYTLQKLFCAEASLRSFDETLEQLEEILAGRIPKRQLEEVLKKATIDFESFYTQVQSSPNPTEILVLSFDGKGVVMRPEDLLVKVPKKQKGRPFTKEKRNRKRMATVSAIYEIGCYHRTPKMVAKSLYPSGKKESRPKAENKQVFASIQTPMKGTIAKVFKQAKKRDPEMKKEWVVLVDGHKAQLEYVKKQAKALGVKVTIIVDLMHVLEYLWKAAHALKGKGSEAEKWVEEKLMRILQGKSGVMAGAMRRSATNQGLSGTARKAVDKCAQYLLNKKPYLRYDQYLSKGYPIATGVIEGACRYLVKDRMDRTGARWRLMGAEAVLKMRALKTNGDFEEYWAYHEEQQRQRNYGGLRKVFSGVRLKQKIPSKQDYERDKAA